MADKNQIGVLAADNLFAGSQMPVVDDEVIIAEGEGILARGTLLGIATKGTLEVEAAAKTGGNTGSGTLTLDAETPVLAGAKAGVYSVRVIRAAVAGVATTPPVPAQFAVAEFKDPGGSVLSVFDVPGTTGITVSNQLKFVMAEGADTPFAVGDGWNITVTEEAASGMYKAVDSTATDGSADPLAVLAFAVDATEGDAVGIAYFTGEFNEDALVFGREGDTPAMFKAAARDRGIYFKKAR